MLFGKKHRQRELTQLRSGLLLVLATACSSGGAGPKLSADPSPPTSQTSYLVLKSRVDIVGDRKRLFVSIGDPEASTFESRGQLVVNVARELQRTKAVDVVQVWLEPNQNTQGLGFVLAMATYSRDGKGLSGFENGVVWADVSSTGYQVNAKSLRMTKDSSLGEIGIEQARIIGSRKPYNP